MSYKASNRKQILFRRISIIQELKDLHDGKNTNVQINLERRTVKQAATLIQSNVQGQKLAFKFDNNEYYFLSDYTITKLMKGFIDENAVVQYNGQEACENVQTGSSDAEYVANIVSVKMLELVIVNTRQNKTKPGGGFFKYYHITKFDLRKYGLYKPDDDPDYSEHCLVIAFREGGMSQEKLQSVKLFVMNRVIPKCELKEVCETLQKYISN